MVKWLFPAVVGIYGHRNPQKGKSKMRGFWSKFWSYFFTCCFILRVNFDLEIYIFGPIVTRNSARRMFKTTKGGLGDIYINFAVLFSFRYFEIRNVTKYQKLQKVSFMFKIFWIAWACSVTRTTASWYVIKYIST